MTNTVQEQNAARSGSLSSMRIDKYLKTARILKRREAAKKLAEEKRVLINGRTAKPGSEVHVGDEVELHFGNRIVVIRVLDLLKQVSKANAALMFEVIHEERTESSTQPEDL